MREGQKIVWHKAAKWGGKDAVSAIFIGLSGNNSAVIKVGSRERIVRLSSISAA